MSLPGNVLSSAPMAGTFLGGRANAITGTLDYETGGVDIADASQGKQVQVWTGKLVSIDIILESPLTSPVTYTFGTNSAYAVTLTPYVTYGDGSSGEFTLGAGNWAASDLNKIITNVTPGESGVASIVSILNNVATCNITVDFTNTNPIASGAWELSDITEFSFTFDQLMRPVIAFVKAGAAKLYWYDSAIPDFVITDIATGALNPRVSLDDKRTSQDGTSDVIVAYTTSSNDLYFQMQRDRYGISYKLASGIFGTLNKIGMTDSSRFMFYFDDFDPFPSADVDDPYTACIDPPGNCIPFNAADPYAVSGL